MNYKEALEYMETLKTFGIVPGLDSIKRLCEKLGNPQDELSFVHIAGTNGKGSVLAYTSTICKCAGFKVGRYISPVIFNYCEKIQVNNKAISQKNMAVIISRVKEACDEIVKEGNPQPTPFEVETAAAFLYFKDQAVDLVIVETGMGGLMDATNLIKTTKVAVLTSIGMDHMQFLGKTLKDITLQKTGIIKDDCYVVSMKQDAEAEAVIIKEADKHHSNLAFCKEPSHVKYGLYKQTFSYESNQKEKYEHLEISLAGRFQVNNAVLAIECIEKLKTCGYTIPKNALYKGLCETVWPVRFEIIQKKPFFILDGAHNEDAAKKLADSIQFYFTNKRIIYIMGMLRDKEYEKVIALTCGFAEQIITVTSPENARSLTAHELAQSISKVHPCVTEAASLEEAVEIAYLMARKEDVIISFGSLSYLGKMKKVVNDRNGVKNGQSKN